MFDLHRLKLLREFKHRGTLSAVAVALSYSPSTISQQLSQLEREVGVRLLVPDGRRLRLTPQAEILVGHAEVILRQVTAAESDIARSMEELIGTVCISAFQTVNLSLIPIMLTELKELHPGLRVEVAQIDSETALRTMLAGDLDLVVGEEYPGHPISRSAELERVELSVDRVRLAHPAGHRLSPDTRGMADLAGRAWVMEPSGCASRQWAVELCRDAGFEPDVRYETSDIMMHLRLVEQGHAVALLPDLLWFEQPPTVPLRPLVRRPDTRKLFTATQRGNGEHPAVAACRDSLLRAVHALADISI